MTAFQIEDWASIIVIIAFSIPTLLLLRYYYRTKMLDYLLFGTFFLAMQANQLVSIVQRHYPDVILTTMILTSTMVLGYFLLFFHAVRLKWEQPPRIFWYGMMIFYAIIQFLILLLEPVTIPEEGIVLFMNMRQVPSGTVADAAVITQGGAILYGKGYFFLHDVFQMLSLFTVIFAYATAENAINDEVIDVSKKLFLSAAICALSWPLLRIGHHFSLWTISYAPLWGLPTVTAIVVIAYTTVRYPEAVLISQVQIIRARNLYKIVDSLEPEKAVKKFGMPSLIEYLRNIPPELTIEFRKQSRMH